VLHGHGDAIGTHEVHVDTPSEFPKGWRRLYCAITPTLVLQKCFGKFSQFSVEHAPVPGQGLLASLKDPKLLRCRPAIGGCSLVFHFVTDQKELERMDAL